MGVGALAGGLFGTLSPVALAGTLGFAAGAMLFWFSTSSCPRPTA